MKSLLLLLTVCFTSFLMNAQVTANLSISGIKSEIEKQMLPEDMVSFFGQHGNFMHKNVKVELMTPKGKKLFFGSYDVKPDANGHYTFDGTIEVKEGYKVDLSGEIELLVWVETICGNVVWTRVQRTLTTLSDPIELDHYNERQGTMKPTHQKMRIQFSAKSYEEDMKEKLAANNDNIENRDNEDFHLMLKNVGDTEWKVDIYEPTGGIRNRVSINSGTNYFVRSRSLTENENIQLENYSIKY